MSALLALVAATVLTHFAWHAARADARRRAQNARAGRIASRLSALERRRDRLPLDAPERERFETDASRCQCQLALLDD